MIVTKIICNYCGAEINPNSMSTFTHFKDNPDLRIDYCDDVCQKNGMKECEHNNSVTFKNEQFGICYDCGLTSDDDDYNELI